MVAGVQSRTVDWARICERWLLLAASAYVTATIVMQVVADVPVRRQGSPIELSSDLIASLGLAFAAFQALRQWTHPISRNAWLVGCAGMLMVWGVETAADGRYPVDFRVLIAVWMIASALVFTAVQQYATTPMLVKIMWGGAAAQSVAHVSWVVQGGTAVSQHVFEMLIDTGELMALLSYIMGFVLARLSGLDAHARRNGRLADWAAIGGDGSASLSSRPRICFSFIAQAHQVLHSLPIAVALASRYPEVDVHVTGSGRNLKFIRSLLERNAVLAAIRLDRLHRPWLVSLLCYGGAVRGKKATLKANRLYLSGFDAIVVPERTSTYLKRLIPRLRLVGTEHGAGDREVTFSAQTALFDFLLLPGKKQADRLVELGYARQGRYVTGVYAKLDWTAHGHQGGARLFDNDRRTILYNPHFDPEFSSWPLIGWQILEYFAASTKYNLVFAPHVRLFDAPSPAKYRRFANFQKLPHMLIDLGSERCVDMSYTRQADVYLGDVSSQVVEFIARPRACVFLNPRNIDWRHDPHYRFWSLGPVIERVDQLEAALDDASLGSLSTFERRQRDYFRYTVGEVVPGRSADRGAEAIVHFLKTVALEPEIGRR